MLRLSYPTETVLSSKITRNRIVLPFKVSPRKPLGRRPRERANNEISRSAFVLPEFPFDPVVRPSSHPSFPPLFVFFSHRERFRPWPCTSAPRPSKSSIYHSVMYGLYLSPLLSVVVLSVCLSPSLWARPPFLLLFSPERRTRPVAPARAPRLSS